MKHVHDYRTFISKMCTPTLKPFESGKSFFETVARICKNDDNNVMFIPPKTQLLRSNNLVQRIPRVHRPKLPGVCPVSQLIFILEISNFTKHFLRGHDLLIEDGNQDSLFIWHADEDEKSLPTPSLLHNFKSFVIPPYCKERLIFRNSTRQIKHTRLRGVLTMKLSRNECLEMMIR